MNDGVEYPMSSGRFVNRFKRARMLYSVIQNTSSISRVFKGQVISEVKSKDHNFGMNLKTRRWKFFFRVGRKSKSYIHALLICSLKLLPEATHPALRLPLG